MNKVRVGILGAGMAATPHGAALVDLKDRIEVAGVYTRSPESREKFAAKYGFPVAETMESLIDDPTVDMMLILTPANARIEIIKACAAAGKNILCEKPLERTVAAAQEVVDICETAGVPLGVVFHHRFRPAAQDLRDLLASGELGQIQAVRVDVPWWRDQAYYDEPGRGTYDRDGGGVLINQAIHVLELMLSFTGPVTAVQAMASKTGLHDMESEDFVAGAMTFANGASGALFATTAGYPGDTEFIRLDCDNGAVVLKSGELVINWRDGRQETRGAVAASGGGADPMAFPKDWHRKLIAAFLDAVEEGRTPNPGAEGAMGVQRLIAALIQSSDTGKRVELANLDPSTAPSRA